MDTNERPLMIYRGFCFVAWATRKSRLSEGRLPRPQLLIFYTSHPMTTHTGAMGHGHRNRARTASFTFPAHNSSSHKRNWYATQQSTKRLEMKIKLGALWKNKRKLSFLLIRLKNVLYKNDTWDECKTH